MPPQWLHVRSPGHPGSICSSGRPWRFGRRCNCFPKRDSAQRGGLAWTEVRTSRCDPRRFQRGMLSWLFAGVLPFVERLVRSTYKVEGGRCGGSSFSASCLAGFRRVRKEVRQISLLNFKLGLWNWKVPNAVRLPTPPHLGRPFFQSLPIEFLSPLSCLVDQAITPTGWTFPWSTNWSLLHVLLQAQSSSYCKTGCICRASSRSSRSNRVGASAGANYRPHPEDPRPSDAADRSFGAEANQAPCGSNHRSLGQRVRKFIKWLRGSRRLHFEPSRMWWGLVITSECCPGFRPDGESDRQWTHETLRGEAYPSWRSKDADLYGSVHGLLLADRLRAGRRIGYRPNGQRLDDGRADLSGWRKVPVWLASERYDGTKFWSDHYEPKETGSEAVLKAGSCTLGCRQQCVLEGPGFFGEQIERPKTVRSIRTQRRPTENVAASPKEEREQGRFPRQRRSQLSRVACPDVITPSEAVGVIKDTFETAGNSSGSDVPARPCDSCQPHLDCSSDPPIVSKSDVDPVAEGLPDLQSSSSEGISFLKIIRSVLQESRAVHAGLSQFLQLSVQRQSRSVHEAPSGLDLWPCPIPHWWTGPTNLSPKRRRRRRFHQIRSEVLQHVIGVLNWESLGHPTKPPERACIGQCFSDSQWLMICRLERLVDHFLRAGSVSGDSLGRSFEKFSKMLAFAKALPECREVDLFNLMQEVAKDLDPYQSKPPTKNRESADRVEHVDCCRESPASKLSMSVAKPTVASRIKWEHSPAFDPIPFFQDQIVRDAFMNPESVKLPKASWVDKPRGRVHCSRQELLKLAQKWDDKGACRIFRTDEINLSEAVGLFGVPKDATFDRLILNPQVVNGRMMSFSHYTKELAPGSLFTLIRLSPESAFRVNADDLAEMYYTIKVPDSRAKRNSIGVVFDADELAHLSCFDASNVSLLLELLPWAILGPSNLPSKLTITF